MPFELLERDFSREYQFADPFPIGTRKKVEPLQKLDPFLLQKNVPKETVAEQNPVRNKSRVISIQPGTKVDLILDRAVGSEFSQRNQILYGKIDNLSLYNLPENSIAEIMITDVEKASRFFAKPGKIKLEVNRIILPKGESLWIQGELVDAKGRNEYLAESNLSSAARSFGKLGIAAGTGALGGLAAGKYADGEVSKSVLVGAGVGTVVGGVWIALSRGKNITLPAGMRTTLIVNTGTQVVY